MCRVPHLRAPPTHTHTLAVNGQLQLALFEAWLAHSCESGIGNVTLGLHGGEGREPCTPGVDSPLHGSTIQVPLLDDGREG